METLSALLALGAGHLLALEVDSTYKGPVMGQQRADPDSKVHGANMGPTWGRQDPGGPHISHMNIAIWELS